jgi:hypothetical protein
MKQPFLLFVIIAFASFAAIDKSIASENTRSYTVTFNVNMTDAEGFNPDEHTVYLTGSFTGWAEPGTGESITMEKIRDREENLVYTTTLQLAADQYEYKYFSDAFGAGWNGGEWPGDPNRSINVEKNTPVFNRFGDITTYAVSLEITNEDGVPLNDAIVTINGIENDPGNHDYQYVTPGDYELFVENAGYNTYHQEFIVDDEDLALTIVMEAEEEPVYTLTFVIENEDGEYITDAIITLNDVVYDAGNYVFENLSPGNYLYTVEKAGYESAEGEVVVVDEDVTQQLVLTAIETYVSDFREPEIAIYPNPVSRILYVNSPDVTISSTTMLDMLGRIVYDTAVNDSRHEIDVSGLENGIYFLRIDAGRGIITQRIQVVN